MSAQYMTSDYSPTLVLNEGLSAPGGMAIDTDENVYVTDAVQKNNQLFAGDKATGNSYKVAQYI